MISIYPHYTVLQYTACLILVSLFTMPLLVFHIQVKLFTYQPLFNDGGCFGRCAGFLGSPICLFNRTKWNDWPQIVGTQFCEAWGTKYLGFPNFEATGISMAILEKGRIVHHYTEATVGIGNPLDLNNFRTHFDVYNPSHFVATHIVYKFL